MLDRKRRSREEWQQLVERQSQSGLGIAEFCREHDLSRGYFYRKRRQLKAAKALVPADSSFVQVSSGAPAVSSNFELQYRDIRLQLPPTTDPAWLAQMLQSL